MSDENFSGTGLTLAEISRANLARARRWHPGGIDEWSRSDWTVALVGEAGELAEAYLALALVGKVSKLGDTVKKLNRERDGIAGNALTLKDLRAAFANELADVYLYLDLVAQREGFDLAAVVREKFNAVSERMGFPERLPVDAG